MKKIFGVLLFMLVLTTSAKDSIKSFKSSEMISHDCVDATLAFMDNFNSVLSDAEVSCLGNVYYANCEGYSVNYSQCY